MKLQSMLPSLINCVIRNGLPFQEVTSNHEWIIIVKQTEPKQKIQGLLKIKDLIIFNLFLVGCPGRVVAATRPRHRWHALASSGIYRNYNTYIACLNFFFIKVISLVKIATNNIVKCCLLRREGKITWYIFLPAQLAPFKTKL